MTHENYERIINKIAKSAGVEKEDIERKIEAKRAKLSGLVTKEGAAQIIAAELGISFSNERLKIEELLPGMKKVSVIGKTITLFPVRKFTRNGQEGKVVNIVIADETSNIRVVLWDTNHISLIEKGEISNGDVVFISNASMRDNELHLGSFSEIKISDEILEDVKTEKSFKEKTISNLKVSDNANVRAFVVQSFEPKTFNVCPECNKKVNVVQENFVCDTHNNVIPQKRGVINIVLDDGTGTIRTVAFHNLLTNLGISIEDSEKIPYQREDLLGKEMVFSGSIRVNKFFNEPEFILEEIKEVNLDELIQKLER